MMTPEGTGALLVAQPEAVGGYRIPDSIAQPARELAALDTLYRASAPVAPEMITRTAEQVNSAVFDYASAVMVHGARRTEGALQDSEYAQATRAFDSDMHHAALTQSGGIQPYGELPASAPPPPPPPGMPPEAWAPVVAANERQNPTSVESVEVNRRERVETLVTQGDYSTARAEVGAAIRDYTTAARAARALGDEDTARTMETAATAYSTALPRIDSFETAASTLPTAERPSIEHPSGQLGTIIRSDIGGAGDPADLARGVADTRDSHDSRSTDDMIEVKEHIDARIPRDKRPPELYDTARHMPLTPTVPGLGQTPRDTG
jgi:hypothetical protein